MGRTRPSALKSLADLIVGVGKLLPTPGFAASGSLYNGPGPRPGPDVLDAAAPTAPQLTNVSAVTINPKRAGVDCSVDLRVSSDGPLTIALAGCKRTVSIP